MNNDASKQNRLTILLPAGRLPLPVMAKAYELAQRYGLEVYLSTLQNLRLMGLSEEQLAEAKAELAPLGVEFKGPGKFPVPRVCIGKRDCTAGVQEPEELSRRLLAHFQDRGPFKPKIKIAISGCPFCCSGVKTTDIGIMGTKQGYDIYAGGKGGPNPLVGRRIARAADADQVIKTVETLLAYHDAKTPKKQRLARLLDEPDFPFPEV
ncbi:nitrite reductase [Desulfurivibrio alkaliphilus]|uniref:Nitrite and sulphite reductase 4Fe-4S region n=1 Tax=Desulfurivibrio alkaliphilus (strain DSM 19089 / UNIQEM U267 / AHT2) TaxID=589865 RepID=D6Z2Z0_DESAT|nr:nitrite reductase [Desulfurivibrio alkaliphilus]ADH85915.1 nitrite and sulphite reductase 4Fe-4S region [Desulfurivibrio alkaliphilus AHT 2]